MASNVDPRDARRALSGLDTDRARLAAKVVTPRWYHPVYASILAGLVLSQALPPFYGLTVVIVGLIGLIALRIAYDRRYGISFTKVTGRRTRALMFSVIGVLVAGMIASRVIVATGASLWWVLVPAAIAFVTALVLGPRYDDALRREIVAR